MSRHSLLLYRPFRVILISWFHNGRYTETCSAHFTLFSLVGFIMGTTQKLIVGGQFECKADGEFQAMMYLSRSQTSQASIECTH